MLLFIDPLMIHYLAYIQGTIFCHILSKMTVLTSWPNILIIGVILKQTNFQKPISHIIKVMTKLLQIKISDTVLKTELLPAYTSNNP